MSRAPSSLSRFCIVIAVAAAIPSTALAAPPGRSPEAIGLPVRLVASLYEPCFSIENATGADPLVVIHRRDGTPVDTVSVPLAESMRACTGTLKPSDTIEIRQSGSRLRRFTVPALRLRLDVTGHRITGWVPPARGSAVVDLHHRIAGLDVHEEGGGVVPASDGEFTWTPSSAGNLWRGDIARLTWTSPTFDTVTLYASTPSVTVSTWTARLTATGRRADQVRIQVRHDGIVRAGYSRRLPPYEVLTFGTLRRSGRPKAAVRGDKVVHAGIDGVAATVLSNGMTVQTDGRGELTTTCFPGGQAVVDVNDESRWAFTVPPSGRLNVIGLVAVEGELQADDVILVGCQNRKGGAQLKRFIVPSPGAATTPAPRGRASS